MGTSKHQFTKYNSPWREVLEGLADIRNSDLVTLGANIVLCSGSNSVCVHEILVRKFTTIFHSLSNTKLDAWWSDLRDGDGCLVVIIPDISSQSLTSLRDFLYTGEAVFQSEEVKSDLDKLLTKDIVFSCSWSYSQDPLQDVKPYIKTVIQSQGESDENKEDISIDEHSDGDQDSKDCVIKKPVRIKKKIKTPDKTKDHSFTLDKQVLEALGRQPSKEEVNQMYVKMTTEEFVTSEGDKKCPFVCLICGKSNMFNKQYVRRHVKTHVEKDKPLLMCEFCPETFKCKSGLHYHIKAAHTKERPFACKHCELKFFKKAHMELHVRRKHTGDKPFQCQYCPKAFASTHELKAHIFTHTGGEGAKYACQLCPRKFHQKEKFVEHVRIHTGEKPFQCHLCAKTFSKKGNMDAHVRAVHTGNLLHKCKFCPKQFDRRGKYEEHLRNDHGHTEGAPNLCF